MIKLENYEVLGWDHAIRGMRNPMNSWGKSDSHYGCYMGHDEPPYDCKYCPELCAAYDSEYIIGPNDLELMTKLRNAGTDHRKYMRMITVYVDITAPLYWWKEFDTYKVGTVANSCSTMHKIHDKEFTMDDFSTEHLIDGPISDPDVKAFEELLLRDERRNMMACDSDTGYLAIGYKIDENKSIYEYYSPKNFLNCFIIPVLNSNREAYFETKDKKYWWQMIQLLPSSYNQKRTVMLNYEVLANMYKSRKTHKLDEWREFCKWIESLPYSELITNN